MYASYKAIGTKDKEDDTHWLMYWVIFGIFSVVESIGDYGLYWVPFYYELKLAFLVALQFRRFGIAKYLYENVVSPTLGKYESHIDKFINDINRDGFGAITKLVQEVVNLTKKDSDSASKDANSSEGIKRRMVKQPGDTTEIESEPKPDSKKNQ